MTNRPRRHLTRRERRTQHERVAPGSATETMTPAAPATAGPQTLPPARAARPSPTVSSRGATPRQEGQMAMPAMGGDLRRMTVVVAIIAVILAALTIWLR